MKPSRLPIEIKGHKKMTSLFNLGCDIILNYARGTTLAIKSMSWTYQAFLSTSLKNVANEKILLNFAFLFHGNHL
jgi:hypothetical protein